MAHVRSHGRKWVHPRFCSEDRTQGHTRRNRGRFRWGWYHCPRSVPRVSETLRGQGVERQTLPLLGLGGGLSKNVESLRDSDALMRVAVPRRRGPAGLRDLFCFCRNCDLYALFQILLSVLQTLQLVLFLCKPCFSSLFFSPKLFKG